MRIYNSATHKKEEFQPIESGKVRHVRVRPHGLRQHTHRQCRTFIQF